MKKFCSALLLPLLVAAACSSNDGAKPAVIQTGAGGASSGGEATVSTATTGPLPSSGAATTSPSTGSFMPTSTTGEATTGVNPDDVCAGVKLEPQTIEVEVPKEIVTVIETEVPAPIAIYVVLDNSLSMNTGPGGGGPGGPGAGG